VLSLIFCICSPPPSTVIGDLLPPLLALHTTRVDRVHSNESTTSTFDILKMTLTFLHDPCVGGNGRSATHQRHLPPSRPTIQQSNNAQEHVVLPHRSYAIVGAPPVSDLSAPQRTSHTHEFNMSVSLAHDVKTSQRQITDASAAWRSAMKLATFAHKSKKKNIQ